MPPTKPASPTPDEEESKEVQVQPTEDAVSGAVSDDGGSGLSPPELIKEMQSGMMAMMSGQMHPPYMSKIEPEHIGQIINSADKSDERQFQYAKRSQWFRAGTGIVGVLVFIFLVVFLSRNSPTLVRDMMFVVLGLLGGLGAGFGIGRRKSSI